MEERSLITDFSFTYQIVQKRLRRTYPPITLFLDQQIDVSPRRFRGSHLIQFSRSVGNSKDRKEVVESASLSDERLIDTSSVIPDGV